MGHIADTPEPPYTAVVFTAVPSPDQSGYDEMVLRMNEMVAEQPGFLGVESSAGPPEITVSYWTTAEHARAWKAVAEHRVAQQRGRDQWYSDYRVRVCRVERDYGATG